MPLKLFHQDSDSYNMTDTTPRRPIPSVRPSAPKKYNRAIQEWKGRRRHEQEVRTLMIAALCEENLISSEELAQAREKLSCVRQQSMTFNRASVKDECPICQDPLCDTLVLTALRCGHIFHACCLSRWSEISETCPICRQKSEKKETLKGLWGVLASRLSVATRKKIFFLV